MDEADRQEGEAGPTESGDESAGPARADVPDGPDAASSAEGRDPAARPVDETAAPPRRVPARTASIRDALDGGLGRTMRELDSVSRIARDLGLARSRFDDMMMGRPDLTGTGRALAEIQKRIDVGGGIGAFADRMARTSLAFQSAGGIDAIMRRQREMERVIAGLGGLDAMAKRHSAMASAITAMGGMDAIIKRHEDFYSRFALGSLASIADRAASGPAFVASQAAERAMRDLAGVTSFTGLVGRGNLHSGNLDALIASTRAWREAQGNLTLTASLHARLPDLIPDYRRATAADIAAASLSPLGERLARDAARMERVRDEMLGLRRPWVDVDAPGRSVAAYVEARALAAVVETSPAESRAVVEAVRTELGDYRETEPVPELVVADPMLRSAFRLEVGFSPNLSSLPPAIVTSIFASFGGRVPRVEADPEALASAVHHRARRLELKLRRFIEKRMMAKWGQDWTKGRVDGKTVTGWRQRRQLDADNGRRPSRLFDYAGFEDYRAIIERKDNWNEVFAAVFPVKSSILESLRRLSLIRNPAAHFRVVTIEDFLDLTVEGRRVEQWIDAAA